MDSFPRSTGVRRLLVVLVLVAVAVPAAGRSPKDIGGSWRCADPPSTLTFDPSTGTYRWEKGDGSVQSGLYAFTEEDGLEMETGGSWAALAVELSANTLVLHLSDGGILRCRRARAAPGSEAPPVPVPPNKPSPAMTGEQTAGGLAGLWASPMGLVAGFAPSGRFLWFVPGRTLSGSFEVAGRKVVLQGGAGPIAYGWSRQGDRLVLTDGENNTVELARVSLAWGRCPCDVRGRAFLGRTGERLRFGGKGVMELISSGGASVKGRYAVSGGKLVVTGIPGFPRMSACTAGGSLFLKNGETFFIFLPAGKVGTVSGGPQNAGEPSGGGDLHGKWKAQDGSYWAFFKDGTVYFGPEDRILSGRFTISGNRLKIVLDESHRVLRFTFSVKGTAARIAGGGAVFNLVRNDLRRRSRSDGWFYSPDANPQAYGFTWENTWSVGGGSAW